MGTPQRVHSLPTALFILHAKYILRRAYLSSIISMRVKVARSDILTFEKSTAERGHNMSENDTNNDALREELGMLLKDARELRILSVRGAATQVGISSTYLSQL